MGYLLNSTEIKINFVQTFEKNKEVFCAGPNIMAGRTATAYLAYLYHSALLKIRTYTLLVFLAFRLISFDKGQTRGLKPGVAVILRL